MTPACPDEQLLLNAYIDGELDAANIARTEAHVAACADCREELERLRSVQNLLSGAGVRHSVPEALNARIASSIKSEGTASARGPSARAPWWVPASGGAIAAALAMTLVLPLQQQGRLEDQLVASHVRSLQVQHLTDVQTSNEHLVRPWFNGKIDFATPAPELAAAGFPLAGGRLDYIDGRNVAAVVYKRRLHSINLFVWPAPDKGARRTEEDGYSINEWSSGGLRFAAVSDISPAELEQFHKAFVTAAHSS
jgi:anti-sigma factor RsiW